MNGGTPFWKNPRSLLLLGLGGLILFVVVQPWRYTTPNGHAGRLLWGFDSTPSRYKLVYSLYNLTPVAVYSLSLLVTWNSPIWGRAAMLIAGFYRSIVAIYGVLWILLVKPAGYYGGGFLTLSWIGVAATALQGGSGLAYAVTNRNPKRPDAVTLGPSPEPPGPSIATSGSPPALIPPPPATP